MDESESPTHQLRVREATFLPMHGRTHIIAHGENMLDRAVPLVARLGEQDVDTIVIDASGRSFSGSVARTPRAGDSLYVGYADGPLQRTDIVYRGDGEPRIA